MRCVQEVREEGNSESGEDSEGEGSEGEGEGLVEWPWQRHRRNSAWESNDNALRTEDDGTGLLRLSSAGSHTPAGAPWPRDRRRSGESIARTGAGDEYESLRAARHSYTDRPQASGHLPNRRRPRRSSAASDSSLQPEAMVSHVFDLGPIDSAESASGDAELPEIPANEAWLPQGRYLDEKRKG